MDRTLTRPPARPLTRRRGILLAAFLLALGATFLNEVVFASRPASTLISVTVLALATGLAALRFYKGVYWLLLAVFFLLATRPRALHLIALELRGAYEYFSPNILSLGGPSVSTLAVFFVFILLMAEILFGSRPTIHRRIAMLFAFLFGALLVASLNTIFLDPRISLRNVVSDAKYLLFIITGALIMLRSRYQLADLREHVVFLGIILGFSAILTFMKDMWTGELLLQYNHSTYFSIIALGIFLYAAPVRSPRSLTIFLLLAIGAFPVVRGEQLLLVVTLLISMLVFAIDRGTKSKITKILILGALFFAGFTYISTVENSLTAFINRKMALFLTGNLFLDNSSSTRILELRAIVPGDRLTDIFPFLFGRGFGGTFSLDPSAISGLSLADFPAHELERNRFSQPHLFITYWLLKYGLVGSIVFAGFLFAGFPYGTAAFRSFVIAAPTLFWQGYWSPGYALLTGFFWAMVLSASAAEKGLDRQKTRRGSRPQSAI